MKFETTALKGVCRIRADLATDERGFFARLWCREEFQQQGIDVEFVQSSVSHNTQAGTLRGLHFQWPPSREAKLVRCERGSIYDVVVDLRPTSPTFTRHLAVELDSKSRDALYIPPGFAHGFQTLQADCDVVYMMSDYFEPELAGGVRFSDAAFGIHWPLPIRSIVPRDRDYQDFDKAEYCRRYAQHVEQGGKPV